MGEVDAWTMRGAVICYGLYNTFQLLKALGVRLSKSNGIIDVLKQYYLYHLLAVVGVSCITIFTLRPMYESPWERERAWSCMLSLVHTLYGAVETRISLKRMPSQLLSPSRWKTLCYVMNSTLLLSVLRVAVNAVVLDNCFAGTANPNFRRSGINIATTAINMLGSFIFACTELYVYFLSVSLGNNGNHRVHQIIQPLAAANLNGAVAGVIDVLDQYFQTQVLEALVLCFGMKAFTCYATLLELGDEEKAGLSGVRPAGKFVSNLQRMTEVTQQPVKNVNMSKGMAVLEGYTVSAPTK